MRAKDMLCPAVVASCMGQVGQQGAHERRPWGCARTEYYCGTTHHASGAAVACASGCAVLDQSANTHLVCEPDVCHRQLRSLAQVGSIPALQ